MQLTQPKLWFNVLHAHDTIDHLRIFVNPIRMDMGEVKDPWWSSVDEFGEDLVDTFGDGVTEYFRRFRKQVSYALDPNTVEEDWNLWAGWREYYVEE